MDEIEDHLREAVERQVEGGVDRTQAEFAAVAQFGDLRQLARRLSAAPAGPEWTSSGPRAAARVAAIGAVCWPVVVVVYVVRIVLAPSSGSLYLISDLLTAVAVGLSVSTLLLLLAATTIDRRALAVLAALGLAVVALQGSSMLGWMWPIAAVVTTGLAVGVLAAPGGRRLTGGLPLALLSTGWLIGSALAMATPYLFVGPIDDYGYAILPGLVGMGIGAGAATLALGLIAARGGLRARFSHGDLALTGSP